MSKIYNSEKQLVQYEAGRKCWRCGDYVYKQDPIRLNAEWRENMEKILTLYEPKLFAGFIKDGYRTKYIDGQDLHGNKPFEMDGKILNTTLPFPLKVKALRVFGLAVIAGKQLGITFGDLTCGNLLTDGEHIYLIDYEVIVPWPLAEPYQKVWENTLAILYGHKE